MPVFGLAGSIGADFMTTDRTAVCMSYFITGDSAVPWFMCMVINSITTTRESLKSAWRDFVLVCSCHSSGCGCKHAPKLSLIIWGSAMLYLSACKRRLQSVAMPSRGLATHTPWQCCQLTSVHTSATLLPKLLHETHINRLCHTHPWTAAL